MIKKILFWITMYLLGMLGVIFALGGLVMLAYNISIVPAFGAVPLDYMPAVGLTALATMFTLLLKTELRFGAEES